MTTMPALYLGHGAPPLVDDAVWPDQLARWAAELPRPRAILVVSAHWESAPLTIGAAHVAVRDKDSSIKAGSGHPLTFSGRSSMTIPSNAIIYSDPVNINVPNTADLAIDLFLPGDTDSPAPLTMHDAAIQTNYISQPGNHSGKEKLPVASTIENWFIVYRVEVEAPASVKGLVAFGDID